jgi:hypothetical protein
VVVTATFRLLYVFVIMEYATRRLLHCNVTLQAHRHRLPDHLRVRARPILGGLHHD